MKYWSLCRSMIGSSDIVSNLARQDAILQEPTNSFHRHPPCNVQQRNHRGVSKITARSSPNLSSALLKRLLYLARRTQIVLQRVLAEASKVCVLLRRETSANAPAPHILPHSQSPSDANPRVESLNPALPQLHDTRRRTAIRQHLYATCHRRGSRDQGSVPVFAPSAKSPLPN